MPETVVSSVQSITSVAPQQPVQPQPGVTDMQGVASFVAAPRVPIHTIPDRFLPSKNASAPVRNKKSKLGLVVLIGLIWIAVIGVVLWMTLGKKMFAQPSPGLSVQQPVLQGQQPQSEGQSQENALVPPQTIESAVRNGAGKIISRAILLIPETEQGVSFTVAGKSIADDATPAKKIGLYGEYVIRPVAPVTTPLSFSIAIPQEDIK